VFGIRCFDSDRFATMPAKYLLESFLIRAGCFSHKRRCRVFHEQGNAAQPRVRSLNEFSPLTWGFHRLYPSVQKTLAGQGIIENYPKKMEIGDGSLTHNIYSG